MTDLTDVSESPVPPTPARRWRPVVAGLVAAVAVGVLLWQGLGSATVYFKTASEAVAQRDELGDRRFRLEGVVVDGSRRAADGIVEFQVEEDGVRVDVVHRGDPPELFQDSIPVVLEGRWQGDHFSSDRILVKHTSEYREENPDRVKDYPKQ
jgi:cytochrome c-type biogenesis protein CcmE